MAHAGIVAQPVTAEDQQAMAAAEAADPNPDDATASVRRRRTMTRRSSTLAAALAALFCVTTASVASAIGEDEDPAVVYCQSLVALSASVDALSAISTGSTVDEFETAVGDVRDAATAFGESLRGLVDAQVETLETAVGELEGYRDSLEGDETIEEAVQGAAATISAVAAARTDVATIPNCAVVAGQEAVEEETEE
jgi:hypothetical protein